MEGEDSVKTPAAPSAAPPPSLVLEVVGDSMKIPTSAVEVTVMAKLSAVASSRPEEEGGEDSRAPITICAAIDRSGSMRPHLPLLKETLLFMIQQLRPKDQLCLVTFDNEVRWRGIGGGCSHLVPLKEGEGGREVYLARDVLLYFLY